MKTFLKDFDEKKHNIFSHILLPVRDKNMSRMAMQNDWISKNK